MIPNIGYRLLSRSNSGFRKSCRLSPNALDRQAIESVLRRTDASHWNSTSRSTGQTWTSLYFKSNGWFGQSPTYRPYMKWSIGLLPSSTTTIPARRSTYNWPSALPNPPSCDRPLILPSLHPFKGSVSSTSSTRIVPPNAPSRILSKSSPMCRTSEHLTLHHNVGNGNDGE